MVTASIFGHDDRAPAAFLSNQGYAHHVGGYHLDDDAWVCRRTGSGCDRSDESSRTPQASENDQGMVNDDDDASLLMERSSWTN